MISPELIEKIREQADIVQVISSYINVIKKGNSYVAVCPFHADKNPSLMISKSKQIYKCFSCGAGGNVFTFVQEYEHISFMDAVRKVAELIGFQDDNLAKPIREADEETVSETKVLKAANELYQYLLKTQDGLKASEYLKNRNISPEMQEYFSLGFSSSNPELTIKVLRSKEFTVEELENAGILFRSNGTFVDHFSNRITFPIFNEYSEVVGFSARRIIDSDESKYVNSPNTHVFNKSKVLYNYQNAKIESKKEGYVYITEGFMDVFSLYTVGIKSAVALMGTAFTQMHAKMLRKLNVELRLCLDGDEAGQHGMLKMIEILDQEKLSYKIVDYGKCILDPDEILQKYGPDTLKKLTNRLIERNDFIYNYYAKKHDLKNINERKLFIKEIIPVISKITNNVDREFLIDRLTYDTGISSKTIESQLSPVEITDNFDFTTMHENMQFIRNISRLKYLENETLYCMLTDNNAIDDFMFGGDNYFITDIYETIANYIIDKYQNTGNFDVSSLITKFQENNDSKSKDMIGIITDLISGNSHAPYSHEMMVDYLNKIKGELDKKQWHDKLNYSYLNDTPEEQAKLAQEYLEARKELKD